jgi:hypothetical protein
MARVIRLGDIGDYANTQMEKLLKSAVLDTDTLLKSASPVDTGRFRASWQVGENATSGAVRCWATGNEGHWRIQGCKPNRQASQHHGYAG